MFDGGEEGGILGSVDACVVWCLGLLVILCLYYLRRYGHSHPHGSRFTSAIGNGSCGGERT